MEVENLVVITGVDFTMVLTGLLSDLEKYPLRIITFIDDNLDPGAGQAKFRYGHLRRAGLGALTANGTGRVQLHPCSRWLQPARCDVGWPKDLQEGELRRARRDRRHRYGTHASSLCCRPDLTPLPSITFRL